MSPPQTPAHPGTIVFVNADTGEERVIPIAEVPEPSRFVPGPDGAPVPVVRVTSRVTDNQRTIQELGPDGSVLRLTIQVKNG